MNKYFFDEQNKTAVDMRSNPIVKDKDKTRTYELQKILGTGASCVVYVAKESGRSCLLKEFNPKYGNITRNDNGELICEDERTKLLFDEGLRRFKEACEKQNEFRNNSELKNYISPAVSGFDANNTYYSEIVDFNGTDYSKYTDKTLKELLERVRALTKVIGIYHKDGYLHLDIKPENIFVLEEAEKLPILIDFDSITTKKEIELTRVSSYSEEWAAAEQKDINSFVRKVCPATDLFAIGEILFYKLFNRHSTRFERRSFSSFEFNREEGLLKDIDHKIFPLLKEIFNHTICTYIGSRYQTAEELIEKLDKAIEFADPKRAFLPVCNLNTKDFFVGRDNELAEIEQKLKECDELYVSGFGGIGKSELVRQYAKIHKSEFDSIVFITFNIDLKSMLDNINIVNFASIENETIDNRLQRILNKLQEFKKNGEKILFIVDNFDTELKGEERQLFDKFVSCAEKTIVTTRNTNVDGKTMVGIGAIENPRAIFDNYYRGPLSDADDKAVNSILEIFQGHTLAIELLAKQMRASRIVPFEMLEILESKGLRYSGKERISFGQNQGNMYGIIKEMFNVAGLTDKQTYILVNLSLIPTYGISTRSFHDYCGLDSYDDINYLVSLGWVELNEKTDFISVHPLIADIMLERLEGNLVQCTNLLNNMVDSEITQKDTSTYDSFKTMLFMVSKLYLLETVDSAVVDFWIDVAKRFYSFGNSKLLKDCLLKIKTNNLKAMRNDESTINECLGLLYSKNDFVISKKYYIEALNCSFDRKSKSSIYKNLLFLYHQWGRFSEAVKFYNREIKPYIEEISNDKKGRDVMIEEAEIYNYVGVILTTYNRLEAAEKYHLRSLRLKKIFLAENNYRVGISYNNLAITYMRQRIYDKAETMYKKALEIFEGSVGERNADALITYANLSGIYITTKKYQKAKDILEYILPISKDTFGDDLTTATILAKYGILYYENGLSDEQSLYYFKEAIGIYEGFSEVRFSLIAKYKIYIAKIYKRQSEYKKSISVFLDAIDGYDKDSVNRYPKDTALAYSELGELYVLTAEYKNAKCCYLKAIEIMEQTEQCMDDEILTVQERVEALEKLIIEEN